MAIAASDLCAVDCLRLGDGVHYPYCKECLLCFDCRSCRYTPDAVDGIDNVVWLADSSLLEPISQVSATALSHNRAPAVTARIDNAGAARAKSDASPGRGQHLVRRNVLRGERKVEAVQVRFTG
jgi:hypothetical protein